MAALWEVGLEARSVAFGLVFVACAYIALWVGIGAGHLKNYEAPVPVRYSTLLFPALCLPLALLGSVLVLDQRSLLGRTPRW